MGGERGGEDDDVGGFRVEFGLVEDLEDGEGEGGGSGAEGDWEEGGEVELGEA